MSLTCAIAAKTVTINNVTVTVHENVPYAHPPLELLRFQYPEPLDRNSTSRPRNDTNIEDCLYYTVIVPEGEGPFPIVFEALNSQMPTVDYVVDKYARHGIAYVGVEYRRGVFGFFSLLTPELPGNLGLHDLIAALDHLHTMVDDLHLDPLRLTLTGEGLAAGHAGLLAVTEEARGSFSSLLLQHGSSLSPYTVRTRATETHAARVAVALGCTSDTKRCLQARSAEEIRAAVAALEPHETIYSSWRMRRQLFTPVIERRHWQEPALFPRPSLLPAHASSLLSERAATPLMMLARRRGCGEDTERLVKTLFDQSVDVYTIADQFFSRNRRNREVLRSSLLQLYFSHSFFSYDSPSELSSLLDGLACDEQHAAQRDEGERYADGGNEVYIVESAHGDEWQWVADFVRGRNLSSLSAFSRESPVSNVLSTDSSLSLLGGESGESGQVRETREFAERHYFWRSFIPLIDSLSLPVHPSTVVVVRPDDVYRQPFICAAVALVLILGWLIARWLRSRRQDFKKQNTKDLA